MAEPPPYPDADDDTSAGTERGATTGTPRWVKVFGVIAIVLVLLVVILVAAGVGPGSHGPGRHLPGGGALSSAEG
jgi:hypothetical protein